MADKPQFECVVLNPSGFQGLPFRARISFSSEAQAQPFITSGDVAAPRADTIITGLPGSADLGGEVASAIFYTDTAPLLGANTVQGAIDALKAVGGSLTFTTRALASANDYTTVPDQSPVRTGTRAGGNFAYWFLDKTATDAVDGVTFLAANIPATPGVGRLVRQFVSMPAWVRKQLIYIDNSVGDNEGSGDTGSKIRSSLEWFMRGMGLFQFFQSLTMSGAQVWPATDRFHYPVRSIEPTASSNAVFSITGSQYNPRAGSCTAASTNPVATLGSEEMATITDAAVADWTPEVDKLIVAANGAFAWIQKNLGGGKARVGPWQTLGGATATAPPNGTAYTVVSLTSMTVLPVIAGGFDTFQVINIDLGTSLRSLSGKTQWLGCKFNFGIDMALQGTFATCHFTGGVTYNFSNTSTIGEINPTNCIFGGCTFRNCDVTWSTGLMEFADCFFQTAHLLAGRTPNGHSGLVGSADLVTSGTYGVGFFDAGAGNPALVLDGSSRLFSGEALFGNGNLGGGTKLRHDSGVFLKGTVPTLRCAAGVELSVPTDPVGPALLSQVGTGTLVGGVATIAATSVAAGSRIVVTRNTPIGTLGAGGLVVPDGTVVPGVSFDVKAIDLAGGAVITDLSTFNWEVAQPIVTANCTTWANYATNFPNGMVTTKEGCFIQGP